MRAAAMPSSSARTCDFTANPKEVKETRDGAAFPCDRFGAGYLDFDLDSSAVYF